MSAPVTSLAEEEKSFTSRKLDILNAMLSDPDVTDSEFRVAAYVMRCVNQQTGEAYLGDDKIAIAVPRCDRQRVWRIRKSLTDKGWWEVDTGHGARASRYRFLDDKVPEIFDRLDFERAKLHAERMRRKAEAPARAKPADVVGSQHKQEARDVVGRPRTGDEDVVPETRKRASDVSGSQRLDVAEKQPVHPQGSPSPDSLPVERRAYPHTREHLQAPAREAAPVAPVSSIAIPMNGIDELCRRVGSGSFLVGFDRLQALGPAGERWMDVVRSRGLSAAELAKVQAEVGVRP